MNMIYSILAVALLSFAAGWQANGWRLHGEIDQLHATWNQAYANQTQAVLETERKNTELNNQIEVNNEAQAKAIDDAHDVNVKLADDIKRLQQSTSRSVCTMPKNHSACQCASNTTQSEFSGASIDLLIQLAREADDAARYANVCHEWAISITGE